MCQGCESGVTQLNRSPIKIKQLLAILRYDIECLQVNCEERSILRLLH